MNARWKTGVYSTRELRRGEYIIHQEARRSYDSRRWSLVSQLIREDDLVSVQTSKGIKTDNVHDVADQHVTELEKEIEP